MSPHPRQLTGLHPFARWTPGPRTSPPQPSDVTGMHVQASSHPEALSISALIEFLWE